MKTFIHDIDEKKKLFYCIINRKKEAFYLSNRLAKTFFPILKVNQLVDFEVKDLQVRKFEGHPMKVYPVSYFKEIINLKPKRVLYDLEQLRKDMKKVLKKYKYFLFLDLEMSMPGYGPEKFIPEIIQAGYVLSNKAGDVLVDEGYYIRPKHDSAINKRTIKFLKLDEEHFFNTAKTYKYFYEGLKEIVSKFKPQIVVWGKNDIQALNFSYEINHMQPLTKENMFIDLLKLHKDYFNLQNDLGLFDAYKQYYLTDLEDQSHDARTDAIITKDVFDAFISQMK
ncbi:hypothetical protein JV173_04140 [Acholeplasma equirhinis]|uniref:hypothetical protein n=1 Tax=Acholeplasma equirhinis TaxID=555393 RepID=UPI00197AA9F0|nr:hypothetical protein [Acholeplasma equirhinis]MBN3490701.1 hypothetical protein [Acholeplasma equirhinis]